MTLDPQMLINGYLDETLSSEEHVALAQWLQETPQHRQQFADAVLLHDRLRGELPAKSAMIPEARSAPSEFFLSRHRQRMGPAAAFFGVVCTLAIVLAVLWWGLGETPASAAVTELNRLIAASAQATDQTYQVSVEEVAMPRNRGNRPQPPDSGRPPKPPPPEAGHKLIEPRNIRSIPANETTIADVLRKAGYATAHYGKWHISGGGPEKHGFDESDGDTGNENAYQFKDPNPVDIFGMADRAAAFMERSSKAKKPFFIQLSWNALHASENANQATLAKYDRQLNGENRRRITTAAITEDLDTGVGRVMEAIERLGLSGTTYVIYMADNGAGGGKKVLAGGKGGVWEGGIRVPFIVRGPGVQPNSCCHTLSGRHAALGQAWSCERYF